MEKTLIITMSGPLVLQLCVVLTLETLLTGVGGAQVVNAKIIRGNIRRDGKILTFIAADACCFSCWFSRTFDMVTCTCIYDDSDLSKVKLSCGYPLCFYTTLVDPLQGAHE